MMWEQAKKWVVEQVLWAEKNLKGQTGKEKKKAVIKRLDDMIVLPECLEWLDDVVLAVLVDRVCDKLNFLYRRDFADLELNDDQEEAIATGIPDPETEGK